MAGALAALIAVPVLYAHLPNVCDGADSLNRGEQRLCQPEAPVDVKMSKAHPDVTAYRYASLEGLATETYTETYTYSEELRKYDYRYFNFALSENGTVSWDYTFSDRACLYLMNVTQYRDFDRRSIRTNLRSNLNVMQASGSWIAPAAGVYYLAIENRYSKKVKAVESVTITTARYKVDDRAHPPVDLCAANTKCVFRAVQPNETIIVQNAGTSKEANVALYAGKGEFNTAIITPIIVCGVVIIMLGPYWLVLCLGCIITLVEGDKKKGVTPTDAPKTPDGGAKVAQPTTDGTVPLTPLGPTPGAAPYGSTVPPAYPDGVPPSEYPDGVPPADYGTAPAAYPGGADSYDTGASAVPTAPPADSGAPSGADWKA